MPHCHLVNMGQEGGAAPEGAAARPGAVNPDRRPVPLPPADHGAGRGRGSGREGPSPPGAGLHGARAARGRGGGPRASSRCLHHTRGISGGILREIRPVWEEMEPGWTQSGRGGADRGAVARLRGPAGIWGPGEGPCGARAARGRGAGFRVDPLSRERGGCGRGAGRGDVDGSPEDPDRPRPLPPFVRLDRVAREATTIILSVPGVLVVLGRRAE